MRSRIDPFFYLRYMRHATPHVRQFIRKLSREAPPVRPALALAAVLAAAAATFIV